jgi:hypothetical protein
MHPIINKDFKMKCYKLRIKLGIVTPFKEKLGNIDNILNYLSIWISRELIENPISSELMLYDVEKLTLLKYFFTFYFSEYCVYSAYDFLICLPYFSIPQ